MELQLIQFYFLLISSIVFFCLLLLKLLRRSRSNGQARLPPGPWQLPVVGSLHHIASELIRGAPPHHALRDLSLKHGPIMHLKLGEVTAIVISSGELAKEVYKTHDAVFASKADITATKISSYGGKDVVFTPYGEYWRQLRKVCVLELLSVRRVNSFRSIREQEVTKLINAIYNDEDVNVSKKIYKLMNDITARTSVGDECKDRDEFLAALAEVSKASTGFNLVDLFPSSLEHVGLFNGATRRARKIHERFDRVLQRIVEEHKESIESRGLDDVDDLLHVLLKLQASGELDFISDDTVKAVILDMLGAGSETSSTAVSWAMSELMKNPAAMRKAQSEVRAAFSDRRTPSSSSSSSSSSIVGGVSEEGIQELSYLKLVIKESLRLHPPAPLLTPRLCSRSCEIGGYVVPKGARVVVNAWAIARDPRVWKDAEEFWPERFEESFSSCGVDFMKGGGSFEMMPFGAGRRICPGIGFAMATMELALAHLLHYFDWELMKEEELDMGEVFGITANKRSDLCLRAVPRFPRP